MHSEYRKEQHYAVSKYGMLVHIKDAHKSNDDFYCPFCRCRMIKKCGKKREWHFAHDYRFANEEQKKCSYETYLHGYAKIRIKQWFDESKSLVLHLNKLYKCSLFDGCFWRKIEDACVDIKKESYDLKKFFNKCDVEKNIRLGEDVFRPDLLWYNEENPNKYIFVEIKVTHECTEQKKNSDAHIIEFEVHSEEDVEKLVAGCEIEESEVIKYYGFKIDNVAVDGQITPQHKLDKFILYSSGKVYSPVKSTCFNYQKRVNTSCFEMTLEENSCHRDYFYRCGLIAAKEHNFDIRNCCICEYYKSIKGGGWCSKRRFRLESYSCAIACEDYKLISGVRYSTFYNDLSALSRYTGIDYFCR